MNVDASAIATLAAEQDKPEVPKHSCVCPTRRLQMEVAFMPWNAMSVARCLTRLVFFPSRTVLSISVGQLSRWGIQVVYTHKQSPSARPK